MAKVIIGIHGLANKPKKGTLKKWWEMAIVEGLHKNCRIVSPAINFEMADYADVYYEGERLTEVNNKEPYQEAEGALERYDEGFFSYLGSKIEQVVGAGVDEVKEHIGWTTSLVDRGLNKVVSDLGNYYTDKAKRNAVQKALMDVLDDHRKDEIMLIAHSMGTIVAYDVLRALGREDKPVKITRFVTIGSPLGLAHVKRKAQLERPDSRLRTPSVVTGSWVNYADRRDYVALDSHLRDDYRANSRGVRVQDDRVINDYPENAHKSYGYLRTPELSEHIAEFL